MKGKGRMNTYIYGAIYTIIYTIMCSLFASVLLGKSKCRRGTGLVLCMLGWMLMEYGVSAVLDQYVVVKMAAVVVLNVIFLKGLYRAGIMKTFGTSFLYQAVCALTDYLSFVLAKKVLGDIELADSADSITGYFIGTFSQILLIFFVLWFRNRFEMEKEYVMMEQEWVKFMAFPVFSMIAILAFAMNFDAKLTQGQENTILFVILGLALMNIFVFYLIRDIMKRESERKREELLLEHAEQTERRYLEEKKRHEELRRQRHEYRNQMLVIQALMEKGDYARIEEYIQSYCGEAKQEDWFDTNHPVVNAILNLKYRNALDKKILMVLRFNNLSELPLKDADLISLLSNLLDNAIEACEKCGKENPQIKVKFVVENGKMILAVSNDWNGKLCFRDGKIISSKEDGKLHGFGMENVKRIVKKYSGLYTIDREGEEFKVITCIPME